MKGFTLVTHVCAAEPSHWSEGNVFWQDIAVWQRSAQILAANDD